MTQITLNHLVFKESNLDLANISLEELKKLILHQGKNWPKNPDIIITEISIDGKSLEDLNDLSLRSALTQNFQQVDITAKSVLDLAFESLDSAPHYINEIIKKVYSVVEFYRLEKFQEANQTFSEIIETLDLFIQLVGHTYYILKKKHPQQVGLFESKMFQDLELHLLSILKALLPAKEKNDIVMLADLLEYELVDNLTQWKIKLIPSLKKLKDGDMEGEKPSGSPSDAPTGSESI